MRIDRCVRFEMDVDRDSDGYLQIDPTENDRNLNITGQGLP
jgi:hypothetical protein